MMSVQFDRSQEIPIVDAMLKGRTETSRTRLVFDTGSGLTQIDTGLMEELGYSARDGVSTYHILGPTGEKVAGYRVNLHLLSVFGKRFENLLVGVVDFDNFSHFGISGLLGFDVIKQLHLELDGANGIFRVF
jgi:hypothetical protein